MGRIKNVYGQVDGLTADTEQIIGRIREQIIPDVKKRWDETLATFQGDGANAFSDITRDFHSRLGALEAAMAHLNGKVTKISGSGGDVQTLDHRLSGLFT
ncbi:hypothetical protein [Nocardia sp. NPDC004750]